MNRNRLESVGENHYDFVGFLFYLLLNDSNGEKQKVEIHNNAVKKKTTTITTTINIESKFGGNRILSVSQI